MINRDNNLKPDNSNNANSKFKSAFTLRLPAQILAVIAWIAVMVLIAWFSAQPADESTAQSHTVGTIICKIVIKDFKTFTQALRQYYIEMVDKFVRKGAHFTEYAFLGILSCTVMNLSLKSVADKMLQYAKKKNFRKLMSILLLFIIPVAWCCLYSVTDEIHQLYVEGRYASFSDVLIDTSGAAFGILIILLIRFIANRIKKHNVQKKTSTKNS